ncbi:hypothetical protein HK103_001218 [Boothiomyces macroporosus]|uniref:Uncharacterized protein n=1 Tax=Boothiomyces macroporosus TaxID=261099 RepID=A0AAD5UK13_9FUNG|nr:hypothetical protein HK103_001218 [Boothiomyces macroporosus]
MLQFLLTAANVNAWGIEGHAIVGSIAQSFLNPNAISYVNQILSANNGDMSAVASWADTFKFTSAGAFSKPLHFVDIQDSPPTSCGFDEVRDCTNAACINTAIQTYTDQLCDSTQNLDALKFLIHFFGDITQPLHNSYRDVGGNSDRVTYNGASTNLHHIWDSQMVIDRISANTDQATYVQSLVNRIQSGDYASVASSWISSQPYNAKSQYGNNLASIEYSKDSDKFDCSYVWKNYDADPSADLSGAYYNGAASIIDLQLAKGGYRLANQLNAAFDGCAGVTPQPPVVGPTPTDAPPVTTVPAPTQTPVSTCAHDKCVVGVRLARGCDPCVDQIIDDDAYCGRTRWAKTCVARVASVCGLTC